MTLVEAVLEMVLGFFCGNLLVSWKYSSEVYAKMYEGLDGG